MASTVAIFIFLRSQAILIEPSPTSTTYLTAGWTTRNTDRVWSDASPFSGVYDQIRKKHNLSMQDSGSTSSV